MRCNSSISLNNLRNLRIFHPETATFLHIRGPCTVHCPLCTLMPEDHQPALPAGLLADEPPAEDVAAKLKRAEYELDFMRKLHIQGLVAADRSQGLTEPLFKLVASYLKLLDSEQKIWSSLGKTDDAPLSIRPPLAAIWKVLATLPELAPILERKEVLEKILKELEN